VIPSAPTPKLAKGGRLNVAAPDSKAGRINSAAMGKKSGNIAARESYRSRGPETAIERQARLKNEARLRFGRQMASAGRGIVAVDGITGSHTDLFKKIREGYVRTRHSLLEDL
jgi:hypothetical protein